MLSSGGSTDSKIKMKARKEGMGGRMGRSLGGYLLLGFCQHPKLREGSTKSGKCVIEEYIS